MTSTRRASRWWRSPILTLPIGMLLAGAAHAQVATPAPSLIDVGALHARLDEAGLVILHVGGTSTYDEGHIPGARTVSLADLSTPREEGRLTLELPDVATLHARLRALGVTDQSQVVVYPATPDNISQATRVVFTLDALGWGGRTWLLDGGLAAWRAAGHPLSTGASAKAAPVRGDDGNQATTVPGGLPIGSEPSAAVATLADVRRAIGAAASPTTARRTVVIDARTPEFYTGASDRRGAIPRPGHVPGAVSLPYTEFFERTRPEDPASPLVLKPKAALEAMLARAGITPGTSLITYCHIGQQATVPYVVARLLGYDVRLYDGSFEEWSATTTVPVKR